MSLKEHRYLRIRRTWIDVSYVASRREGILLYRPGRKLLRIIPWLLSKFAFLPWPSRASWNDILSGFDLEQAVGRAVDYATIPIDPIAAVVALVGGLTYELYLVHEFFCYVLPLRNICQNIALYLIVFLLLSILAAQALKILADRVLGIFIQRR